MKVILVAQLLVAQITKLNFMGLISGLGLNFLGEFELPFGHLANSK